MKRFVVVLDCTAIVSELSDSEFFGHERGAFTGAIAQREGAFALADGGTFFKVSCVNSSETSKSLTLVAKQRV